MNSILHGRDFPAGFPDQSWSRSRRDSGPETGIGTRAPNFAIFWSFLSKNWWKSIKIRETQPQTTFMYPMQQFIEYCICARSFYTGLESTTIRAKGHLGSIWVPEKSRIPAGLELQSPGPDGTWKFGNLENPIHKVSRKTEPFETVCETKSN